MTSARPSWVAAFDRPGVTIWPPGVDRRARPPGTAPCAVTETMRPPSSTMVASSTGAGCRHGAGVGVDDGDGCARAGDRQRQSAARPSGGDHGRAAGARPSSKSETRPRPVAAVEGDRAVDEDQVGIGVDAERIGRPQHHVGVIARRQACRSGRRAPAPWRDCAVIQAITCSGGTASPARRPGGRGLARLDVQPLAEEAASPSAWSRSRRRRRGRRRSRGCRRAPPS